MKKQIKLSSLSSSLQKRIKREVLSKKKKVIASDAEIYVLPQELRKAAHSIAAKGKENILFKDLENVLKLLKTLNIEATKLSYFGEVDRYNGWQPYLILDLENPLSKKAVEKLDSFKEDFIYEIRANEGEEEISLMIDGKDTADWEEEYDED